MTLLRVRRTRSAPIVGRWFLRTAHHAWRAWSNSNAHVVRFDLQSLRLGMAAVLVAVLMMRANRLPAQEGPVEGPVLNYETPNLLFEPSTDPYDSTGGHFAAPDISRETLDEPMGPTYESVGLPTRTDATQLDAPWVVQLLPDGLIYPSYLAGTKESRFSALFANESQWEGIFDGTLGTRVGIFRYGTTDVVRPVGFQVDAEGSAQLRMDMRDQVDVVGVDFRAGVPITFGYGRHRTKFGYYHLSSHVGDEFLLKNPGFNRLNYSRDALVLGHSIHVWDTLRVYAEAAWAFRPDIAKPWEFEFGADYSPAYPTDYRGAPFFAINVHLREEVNFGGGLTIQTGWAWRSQSGHLFRTGVHYYNGESNQFSYHDDFEQQIGIGVWYDS